METSVSLLLVLAGLAGWTVAALLSRRTCKEHVEKRKGTESALKESRERLDAALAASGTGTFRWKIPTDTFECDASLSALLGVNCHSAPCSFEQFLKLVHPPDRLETIQTLRESTERLEDLDVQFRVPCSGPDKVRWVSAKGRVFTDAAGKPLYMTGACTDITQRRHAEESLRSSEERYRSLVAATSSVVWTSSARGMFVAPQHSWQHFTGQRWSEHRGLGWRHMIHPDDIVALRRQWSELRKGTRLFRMECRLWSQRHQTYRYIEARAVPLRTPTGRIREWVGTVVDIHEGRKAQEEERKFKFLSDNANDAYFLANRGSRIVYANRVASELLGYSQKELLGLSLLDIDQKDERGYFEKKFRSAKEQRPSPYETTFTRKDGSRVQVEINLSHLQYGGDTYMFGVARDITERKEVEACLRNHAEELARSNRELEQFAYISSHDLKEPLRMVTVYVQMLQNHMAGRMDEQAQEYLGYAVQGSQRMLALINDLLAYSRVGKELRPFEEVSCEDSVDAAIFNLKTALEESKGEVIVDPLPHVQGSSSQLAQLFQNLIANAVKFRGTEPPLIRISASAVDGRWVFRVKDNGIGIAERYLSRIFVIFQRLHTIQKYPGTGIGLSICKKIVEHHGGTIWVESKLGEGSTFCFSLPMEHETRGSGEVWREPCLDGATL